MEPRQANKLKGLIEQAQTEQALSLMSEVLLSSPQGLAQLAENLAVIITRAYYDFYVDEVHDLYNQLDYSLEGSVAVAIKERLEPIIEESLLWTRRVEALDTERRIRELRLATKTKNYPQVIEQIVFLLNKAEEEKARQNMAELIGTALGSLVNDQEKVKMIIEMLSKSAAEKGIEPALIDKINRRQTAQMEQIFRSQVEAEELEWSRAITATVVEFKTYLPAVNDLSEIKPEENDKFRRLLSAILGTTFPQGKEHRWFVVLELLVEFCPKKLSYVGQLAGTERRLYTTLGPKAQRLVDNTLERLGEKQRLANSFIAFCRKALSERYLRYAIEIMGKMKSPLFTDWLLERLPDKKLKEALSLIISALGESAQYKATPDLISLFRNTTKVHVIDPPRRRRAEEIIRALANIFKHAAISSAERNSIIKELRNLIPPTEIRLWTSAALNLFNENISDIDQTHIDWAVEGLVNALWLKEPEPAYSARMEEAGQTVLGRRQPIVDTIVNIGERGIEALVQSGEEKSLEFSGAFMALAETLERIGSQQSIPLLERLLNTAFTYDEEAQAKKPIYEQEYYWEPAEGRQMPLTKDKVAASLVYAINKIGGTAAETVLLKTYEDIQAGRLKPPGTESARFLMDAAMRIVRKRREPIPSPGVGKEKIIESIETPPALPSKWAKLPTKKLLKKLTSRRLLTKAAREREEKVHAIQELTRREEPQAIALIVRQLLSDDEIIRTAAHASLLQFASLSSEAITNMFCYEIMQALTSDEEKLRTALAEVVKEIDPYGILFRERLEAAVRIEPALLEHKEIAQILKYYETLEKDTKQLKKAEESAHLRLLEEKRRYYEARRRWVENGKRGEPPEKPEGL